MTAVWWYLLIHICYIDKMVAVEGEKSPVFHAPIFGRFEYNVQVLTVCFVYL